MLSVCPQVFQRREDGSVNFFRGWEAYRDGFGKLTGEHWLGVWGWRCPVLGRLAKPLCPGEIWAFFVMEGTLRPPCTPKSWEGWAGQGGAGPLGIPTLTPFPLPGLKRIHQLTVQGSYELRIDLEDFDNGTAFAHYGSFGVGLFSVDPEEDGYPITIADYSGTAGRAAGWGHARGPVGTEPLAGVFQWPWQQHRLRPRALGELEAR